LLGVGTHQFVERHISIGGIFNRRWDRSCSVGWTNSTTYKSGNTSFFPNLNHMSHQSVRNKIHPPPIKYFTSRQARLAKAAPSLFKR
jgi:hypothetical protein